MSKSFLGKEPQSFYVRFFEICERPIYYGENRILCDHKTLSVRYLYSKFEEVIGNEVSFRVVQAPAECF